MKPLPTIEYSECLADTPFFHQNLHQHEIALEETSKKIKDIELKIRKITSLSGKLSQAQRHLATALHDFNHVQIGSMSDDDIALANYSTKELANVINSIEDQRCKAIQETDKYLTPLVKLVERVIKLKDERQKYSKESKNFYMALERNLNLKPTTVNSVDLRMADAKIYNQQIQFCQASLNYVSEIQAVQEEVRIEFIRNISLFFYQWSLFYHMANEIHVDRSRTTYDEISHKIQKVHENYDVQKLEADELKRKILVSYMTNTVFQKSSDANHRMFDSTTGCDNVNPSIKVGILKKGYLYMQKNFLPKTLTRDVLSRSNWIKYYCVYSRETRIFTLIPMMSAVKTDKGGWIDHVVSFKLKSCTKRAADTIDKRFCFDIETEDRTEVLTFQALSELDLAQWVETMDGREPAIPGGNGIGTSSPSIAFLDDIGFEFIQKCITFVEEKGIREQGLYRNCGVNSKVQKLIQVALDPRQKPDTLNLLDPEWEIKTISSAIKTFLRNLPEPLLTFDLHQNFINAAKLYDATQRVQHIHFWVWKLPTTHKIMLEMIIKHLCKVATYSDENLMSISNLAVCFGPTLCRPREETVAAVLDIKFSNVCVETLIANCQLIFANPPKNVEPYPPKPVKHSLTLQMPSDNQHGSSAACSLSEISLDEHWNSSSTISATNPPMLPQQQHRPKQQQLQHMPTTTMTGGGETFPDFYGSHDSVRCLSEIKEPEVNSYSTASTSSSSTNVTRPIGRTVPASGTVKGKLSGTYAPFYNPSTLDKFQQRRVSGSSGGNGPTKTENLYVTDDSLNRIRYSNAKASVSESNLNCSMFTRIPPAYSSFVNPNQHLHPPRIVRTLFPCSAEHETELNFDAGQIITNVYESKEEGWLVGTLNGKTGLIPANYVSFVDNF